MTHDIPESGIPASSLGRDSAQLGRDGQHRSDARPGHFSRSFCLSKNDVIRVHAIIQSVARAHAVSIDDIFSPYRDKKTVAARWEAIRRARKKIGLSSKRLGSIFNRNHTSILHACGLCKSKKKPIVASAPTRPGAMETNGALTQEGRP